LVVVMLTGRRYKTFWYMELYLLVRLAQCVGLLLNDLLTLVVLPRTSPHPLHLFFNTFFDSDSLPAVYLLYVAATLGSPLWSPQRTLPTARAHTAHTAHAQLIRVRWRGQELRRIGCGW
jgi:hypothetical protein